MPKQQDQSFTTKTHEEFYKQFYSPYTKWPKLNLHVYKLPEFYSFDLTEANAELSKLTSKLPLKPFEIENEQGKTRKRLSYRGLCLTSPLDSADPLYEGLNLYGANKEKYSIYKTFQKVSDKISPQERHIEILDETIFQSETDACTPFFKKILDKFKSPYLKVRILELMPGGMIPPHVDFPYYKGVRLHAVLTSNPDVYWEVDGSRFQIPVDGNFYWFDTGRYHAVYNKGKSSRIVLSINLAPYFEKNGQQRISEDIPLIDLFDNKLI